MAEWTTPVTDRASGSTRMTYVDMNRISGNLEFLSDELEALGIAAVAPSKTDWTQNDIVSVVEWESILTSLDSVRSGLQFAGTSGATDSMFFDNINAVESLILQAYNRLQTLKDGNVLNWFAGDGLISGENFYTGGLIL